MRSKALVWTLVFVLGWGLAVAEAGWTGKPSPDQVVQMLTQGNQRFLQGSSRHPHTDGTRLAQAGTQNQGDHAFATVITCSDSKGAGGADL